MRECFFVTDTNLSQEQLERGDYSSNFLDWRIYKIKKDGNLVKKPIVATIGSYTNIPKIINNASTIRAFVFIIGIKIPLVTLVISTAIFFVSCALLPVAWNNQPCFK